MIASFSPFTRRTLAIGLALLAVLLGVNLVVVPLTSWISSQIAALDDARFALARIEAVAARPLPPRGTPVPRRLYLDVADEAAATAGLAAVLSSAGAAEGLQVQTQSASDGRSDDHIVQASLVATGSEAAVLRLINALERGRPAVRLREWTLEAPPAANGAAPGTVSFRGTAIAVWGKAP